MTADTDEQRAAISTRENYAAALRMIREAIETLGPVGILPSPDAVLLLYGPEPVHEAEAIVAALVKMFASREQA